MNIAEDEKKTFSDLSQAARWMVPEKAKIHSLCYEQEDTAQFAAGHKICLNITWEAYEDIQDVYLRMDIKFADMSVVGVTWGTLGSAKAGQIKQSVVEFDLSRFKDGKYMYNISLVEPAELPVTAVDNIKQQLFFEIYQPNDSIAPWNHQDYGHFDIPKLSLVEERTVK